MAGSNFRDPKMELLSKGEIEQLQAEKLSRQLTYVHTFCDFYRRKFDEAGIKPSDIKSKGDLQRLPVATTAEIHREKEKTGDAYCGLLCIPRTRIAVISPPSEFPSLGQQIPEHSFFTAESLADVNQLTNLITRHWVMLGVKPGWAVVAGGSVAASFGAFTYSILPEVCWPLSGVTGELNLTLLPLDTTPDSIGIIVDMIVMPRVPLTLKLKPKAMFTNILLYKKIFEGCQEFLPLSEKCETKVAAIQENKLLTAHQKEELAPGIGFEPYSILALQEPLFYAGECEQKNGLHVFEDYFAVEATDKDGKWVEKGNPGKLTITNLYAEAMPLIRYQSDIDVILAEDACPCGRNHLRLINPEL